MSNTTLFFRSFLIVLVIAGIPHALAFFTTAQEPVTPIELEAPANDEKAESTDWAYYWQGRFEVSYEGLAEKAIYEIREEDRQLNCYSVKYIDAQGKSYDDNSQVMKALQINEYQATAQYRIDYEGQSFETACKMVMDEEGNISLSYDYEGYQGKENWKRIE